MLQVPGPTATPPKHETRQVQEVEVQPLFFCSFPSLRTVWLSFQTCMFGRGGTLKDIRSADNKDEWVAASADLAETPDSASSRSALMAFHKNAYLVPQCLTHVNVVCSTGDSQHSPSRWLLMVKNTFCGFSHEILVHRIWPFHKNLQKNIFLASKWKAIDQNQSIRVASLRVCVCVHAAGSVNVHSYFWVIPSVRELPHTLITTWEALEPESQQLSPQPSAASLLFSPESKLFFSCFSRIC